MRFYKEEDEAYRRVTASLHPTSSKVPPKPRRHWASQKAESRSRRSEAGVDTIEVLSPLAHLIAVNIEFVVLLCIYPQCAHVQTTQGIAEHLRKGHHEKPTIRRQAQDFREKLV